LLFQFLETDISGQEHHAVYMIKREAGGAGRHEVQHIRSFMLDEQEDDQESNNGIGGVGASREGVPNDRSDIPEPTNCPYTVKDITSAAGQHSKTSTTDEDTIDESKDDGNLGVGASPPETENLPNGNAEEASVNTKQYPTESSTKMSVKYSIKRDGMIPHADACIEQVTAAMTTRQAQIPISLHAMSKGGQTHKKSESSTERQFNFVRHPFNGPELHSTLDEDHYGGSPEEVDDHVKYLVENAVLSQRTTTGEGDELIFACKRDAIRQGLFSWLRKPENEREHRHNAAIKILGACSGEVINTRVNVEKDIISLAVESDVPELVRDQSLIAIMDLNCPSLDAIHAIDQVSKSDHSQPQIAETALLTLGVLLRKRRQCKGPLDQDSVLYEDQLNTELKISMKNMNFDRADLVLLAMHNSGSGSHLSTIQHCLRHHNRYMRSIALRHATTSALLGIGEHDDNHDKMLQQSMLMQLEKPLTGRDITRHRRILRLTARKSVGHLSAKTASKLAQLQRTQKKLPFKFGTDEEESEDAHAALTEFEAAAAENPHLCGGGETPLVCYGKRIPQNGNVRSLIGIFGGTAEAMDPKSVCHKYAYVKTTGVVEIFTGIPIRGLNPLSLEVVKLEGRLVLGKKCPCPKTKDDICPQTCKQKSAKSTKKTSNIGGHLMVMGFIVKRFGAVALGEPYDPIAARAMDVPLPSVELNYGQPDIDEPPASGRQDYGFCRFQKSVCVQYIARRTVHVER